MGHSYGGYETFALIEQTQRFKAAVAYAGATDLISLYGHMDDRGVAGNSGWCEVGQGSIGGTPWQYRDRYVENSPIFYLDRIGTPVLIVQGEADTATPYPQADEAFVGLRRLGKEVVYVRYAGEPHLLLDGANIVDYWNRVISWLDGYLKKQ